MRIHGLFIASVFLLWTFSFGTPESEPELTSLSVIADAFSNCRSDIQVRQEGTIIAVLSDDTVGDRHQRIIIRLGNDQTLLIAHNIDLAPRVPNPSTGKTLGFYGEYEWNDEGGVIHWTHEDPDGEHIDGWLEYEGERYGSGDTRIADETPAVSARFTTGSAMRGRTMPGDIVDIQGKTIARGSSERSSGMLVVKSVDNRYEVFMSIRNRSRQR